MSGQELTSRSLGRLCYPSDEPGGDGSDQGPPEAAGEEAGAEEAGADLVEVEEGDGEVDPDQGAAAEAGVRAAPEPQRGEGVEGGGDQGAGEEDPAADRAAAGRRRNGHRARIAPRARRTAGSR